MIPFLDVSPRGLGIESEIRSALDTVFASGSFILGEQLIAFEQEFAAYLGVEFVVGVASGTDALQLALQAAGIGPGDEVITAANTCVPTLSAILASGATPVLADIDPRTYTLDPAAVANALTSRTRSVVPVHLYGHPCDMDAIRAVTESEDILLIEDCAQAHGAAYRDSRCGTLGKAAAFSFYPTKNLGAYGDAGAVATDDAELAETVRNLRNYGNIHRENCLVSGTNSRMDEVQAGILRVKLRHLDAWNAQRGALAEVYSQSLRKHPLGLPQTAEWATHCWHLYAITTERRDELREYLGACDIQTLIHYPRPLHLHDAFAFLGKGRGSFPESERMSDGVLSLPLYPGLDNAAQSEIIDAIDRFFS
ncbi:MAG: DegT/DnrJ/EryC1/StrS family aminotransferase [Candidatus Hydrogenedentes bacterium]|nr:DegT/DnrJ/EryC1/StrS family aminotransferase [Candidatus Hydrogenedentota bacterium]